MNSKKLRPTDLLAPTTAKKTLDVPPYARISFPHAILSTAVYPSFMLSEYNGALAAVSISDHPIQLFNLHNHTIRATGEKASNKVVASYPLKNPYTEQFCSSIALTFPNESQMLAGTSQQRGRVALFDLARPGCEPVCNIQLEQKCRPIVSAIAPSTGEGDISLTAVGYYAGGGHHSELVCGLYDFRSSKVAETYFSPNKQQRQQGVPCSPGVTQLIWSKNNRYLFVIQRQSTLIQVLDSRMGLAQVAVLAGYKGLTNQRLSGALALFQSSTFLFTGSTDGTVCRFDDRALMGMDCEAPLDQWQAHDSNSNVSSISINPITEKSQPDMPLVLATACGQRLPPDEIHTKDTECSIKLWSLK